MSEPPSENPIVMIRGEKVGLGPIRRDLIATYQRWFNELQVTRTLDLPIRPVTFEDESSWFERVATGATVVFTIYELVTMRPIGNLDLRNIDYYNGIAEYGIAIGEVDAWGKGYGTEATRLMLAYAFDVLGLYNVQLAVYTNNLRGLRAYERAGFKRVASGVALFVPAASATTSSTWMPPLTMSSRVSCTQSCIQVSRARTDDRRMLRVHHTLHLSERMTRSSINLLLQRCHSLKRRPGPERLADRPDFCEERLGLIDSPLRRSQLGDFQQCQRAFERRGTGVGQ